MTAKDRIKALTGLPVQHLERLHGGDLSDVFRVSLDDQSNECVAKIGPMVAEEALMLAALRDAGAPVPAVRGCHDDLLLLEYLPEGPRTASAWRDFGAALANLHATSGTRYGWPGAYAFGTVPIPEGSWSNWVTFWREARLLCHLPHIPADIAHRVEALASRLDNILPAAPTPSLLHGDLWTGNLHFSGGTAYMIDPACAFGHSEVDLAMLTLFGAPPPGFWDTYGRLGPDADQRRQAYQLWPALVHLRLFGAGYRCMVTDRLERLGV